MGLDFLPYCFIILAFILALISVVRPNYFFGCYFFLISFLMMKGEKINLGFIQISTFKLFFVVFFIGFTLLYLKNAKSILSGLSKIHFWLLGGVLVSIAPPALSHFLLWHEWPQMYLSYSIKALFPLCFLLYPKKNWDLKKILYSMAISCLVILLINTIPSIKLYWHFYQIEQFYHTRGLFRIRHFSEEEYQFTKYFILNGNKIPVFHLTETYSILWAVLSVPLFYFFLGYFFEKKKKMIGAMVILYLGAMVFINQMLKMLVSEFFTFCFYIGMIAKKKQFSFRKIFITLSLVFTFILIPVLLHPYPKEAFLSKFKIGKIDINRERSEYPNRFQVSLYSLGKLIKNSPWKGFGYPRNDQEDQTLPYGNSLKESTQHSSGIDLLFYFGLLFGWFASYLFIAPVIFCLCRFKRWWKVDPESTEQFLLLSLLSYFFHYLAKIGESVEVNSLILYYLLMLVVFDSQIIGATQPSAELSSTKA